MNIKITYNWLLEYLDTQADPYDLQKYLSLCGPGFERVDKVGDDYVFDIEVTSNRVDMASVFGIAQEAQSILPQFGIPAKLKFNPLEKYRFSNIPEINSKKSLDLDIEIRNPTLCSRFTALIFSNISIKPSPSHITQRLEMCDIRSINNVVDTSNYLMLSLGQPVHVFDYDKIKNHKMIVRESLKDEKLITLDGKETKLPGGDIVIEDGEGKLIDLCGIMGGANSEITNDTKNVILFVQTYNKKRIRKTSMLTGQRSVAATYFEKGLDEERVEPTLVYGTELLQDNASGKIDSALYDIYPKPYTSKTIQITYPDIKKIMGIDLDNQTVISILQNLGFQITSETQNNQITVTVPSFRKDDINIKQDIVEEIARVYGYDNLPNNIQPTTYVKQPKDLELLFVLQQKVKYFFKHLGFNEVMNYSMISEDLIQLLDLKKEDHLMLANTISEEIKYMRRSLLPSLIKNIKDNEGKKNPLQLFELSKVYFPKMDELPDEHYTLSFASTTDFYQLKGAIEALFRDLHITNSTFEPGHESHFLPHIQAKIYIAEKEVGVIGQLKPMYTDKLEIRNQVVLAELSFQQIISNYHILPSYEPPNQFAVIKLDHNIHATKKTFEEIKKIAHRHSPLLQEVELIDIFKDTLTIRLYFSAKDRNITEDEAKDELKHMKGSL